MNGRTNSSDVTIQEINYGALIPLEAPTNLVLTPLNARVDITWTDPVDKVASPGGEDVALWDRTVIIRKAGSAPIGPDDGELIYTETTRNQHQYDVYSDANNVVNNTVYYYAVYAYTQMDMISDPVVSSCKPIAGTPVFLKSLSSIPEEKDRKRDYGGSFYNYAIYAGGWYYQYREVHQYDTVTCYNDQLTTQWVTPMSEGRDRIRYAHTTSNLILGGGCIVNNDIGGSGTAVDTTDVYNLALTHQTGPTLSNRSMDGAAASFRGNAIFAGGLQSDTVDGSGNYSTIVDSYNDSLTKQSLANISGRYFEIASSASDDFAIFAGGKLSTRSSTISSTVEAYDQSLTKSTATSLSKPAAYFTGDSLNGLNIFCPSDQGKIIEAYDSNLSKIAGPSMDTVFTNTAITIVICIRLGGYVLMVNAKNGGIANPQTAMAAMLDDSLTYSVIDGITNGNFNNYDSMKLHGAARINNKYALFGPSLCCFEAI